ncbi:MAG: hypothetical protein HFJ91_04530 [Muribaculaceae bacterium]|nr:hypothetical protein [Muribaculaceae bacterium]
MKKIYLYILLFFACVNASAQVKPVIAVLGDSYSTFQDFVEPSDNVVWYFPGQQKATDVTDVRETWWQILAREGGYRIGKNNSYSGSTVCRTGYREEDYTDRAFITRMTDLGDPDILLIFGATNDSWAKVPIGEYVYSNWKPMQLYSFRPAMAKMLWWLTNRYPNVDIRFILNSELSEPINESVREICSHYGVPVIELHDIDKMSGHPSVLGMRQIADQVGAALRK